ncbi:sensor histidine kinase [Poritiphilus flavus]|uniref:Histidine kinase n=1 Tax=Poritiphilus flavus TaxID=2697053 RepID=A0A6L9E781_9FLAO|nr:histidine kinase [Poritiphilus flavus]NAS10586.1 histidine kinase [Poritiphilus flavus]
MISRIKGMDSSWKEVFFQVLLHVVLFIFYSFDKEEPGIEEYQIALFLNYAIGALIINYLFIPRLYYKKKYLLFVLASALVVGTIIITEEFVLEQIYFPDTRGTQFQGVIYGLLDVMPVIIILSGFKFAWDASKKQTELEALRVSAHESELQFLKSQINPHFLFNNLNNLYSYAIENSPKTPSIILELSSVLRYMLYDCKERYVPLSKEIEHLQNFTKLHQLQIENRGQVEFKTDNNSSGYAIAPLILSVFLENAFKHSTASQSKGICIKVALLIDQKGLLAFQCRNTFETQTNTEDVPHGIGLLNVKKRLNLLYPEQHKLHIESQKDLYSVDLSMQLKRLKA